MRPGIATNYTPKRSAATDDELDLGRQERQSDISIKKTKGKKLICKFSCDNCLEWNGQAGKERKLARNKRRSS